MSGQVESFKCGTPSNIDDTIYLFASNASVELKWDSGDLEGPKSQEEDDVVGDSSTKRDDALESWQEACTDAMVEAMDDLGDKYAVAHCTEPALVEGEHSGIYQFSSKLETWSKK